MLANTKRGNTKLFPCYYHPLPSAHMHSNFIVTVTEHTLIHAQTKYEDFLNTFPADCKSSSVATVAAAALWCCHCYQHGLWKAGNDDMRARSTGDNGNYIYGSKQNQSVDRTAKGQDDGNGIAFISSFLIHQHLELVGWSQPSYRVYFSLIGQTLSKL